MLERPVRVLIVDDSAFMRKALREMLERTPLIEVVDAARDGMDALEKIQQLQPDVVTIDLLMPGMSGMDFIREQMKRRPLPIVVCSSTVQGGDAYIQAIEAGAVEFVQKPTARALDSIYHIRRALTEAVLAAATITAQKLRPPLEEVGTAPETVRASAVPDSLRRISAVVIGVSTGGPRALRLLAPMLPAGLPVPVVIALHIPPGYTQQLADRLNELSPVEVLESEEGMDLRPGRVILARAGVHTLLERNLDGHVCTHLSSEPQDSLYVPSVDALFMSGARIYGRRLLGIVLTGMGSDGTGGAAWIKAEGGMVFAEAKETSVVYGMPRSVVEAGLADRIVPLDEIPNALMEVLA